MFYCRPEKKDLIVKLDQSIVENKNKFAKINLEFLK